MKTISLLRRWLVRKPFLQRGTPARVFTSWTSKQSSIVDDMASDISRDWKSRETTLLVSPPGIQSLLCGDKMRSSAPTTSAAIEAGYYAMARAGLFFKPLARIHPRSQTPVASLLAQGAWSCVLVLSGTYDQLITYIVFASWVFYAMSCGAVIILRRRKPDLPRPYKPVLFYSLLCCSCRQHHHRESPRRGYWVRDDTVGHSGVLVVE